MVKYKMSVYQKSKSGLALITSGNDFGEEIFETGNEITRKNSVLVKEYCEFLVINKANILSIQ